MTNDKTLEADADFCDSADKHRLTNGLTQHLQTENTELKKHIKVLAEALNKLAYDEFPAVGFRMDVAQQALASLPAELRGL